VGDEKIQVLNLEALVSSRGTANDPARPVELRQ
jgi:hypothetical protein